MLDYPFIDTLEIRVYGCSGQDIKIFNTNLKEKGLDICITHSKARYNTRASYKVKVTFAKYKPLFDYSGNDTTNIQPAPLDIYKVFFNAVHELIYGQSENIFDEREVKVIKIDVTKQFVVKESPKKYIDAMKNLKISKGYKSCIQNSCFYLFHPKRKENGVSNYNNVFKVYDKQKEIEDNGFSDKYLILKRVPSSYSIEQFGNRYYSDTNSLDIKNLKMLRAEISLKEKCIDILETSLDISEKCNLLDFLRSSILDGTFYDKLNEFFVCYLNMYFDIHGELVHINNPLKLFKSSYESIENPIFKSYINNKSMSSCQTHRIITDNCKFGLHVINTLSNKYVPPKDIPKAKI